MIKIKLYSCVVGTHMRNYNSEMPWLQKYTRSYLHRLLEKSFLK